MIALVLSMATEIDVEATIMPECTEIQLDGNTAIVPEGTYSVRSNDGNYTLKGPKRLPLPQGHTSIETEGCTASEFDISESISAEEVLPKKKSILLFSFLSGAVGLVLLLLWRR